MKRIFTRSSISIEDAAKQQHKRVQEALLILLALVLLSLGIAGFQTLLKTNLRSDATSTPNQNYQTHNSTLTKTAEIQKKNLLTYLFSDLKLSCSPLMSHTDTAIWNGVCRSIDNVNSKTYSLSINSTLSPKKYKGFKLAKEVFYVITKREALLAGKHTAFSFSSFMLAGATFVKISKTSSTPIYLFGVGLGLGFLIDKKMQVEFKEIPSNLTAKN
jgi:hypothetical protein